MLQFKTDGGNVVFINPRHVTSVWGSKDDLKFCTIRCVDGDYWRVEGSAFEQRVRIWRELV